MVLRDRRSRFSREAPVRSDSSGRGHGSREKPRAGFRCESWFGSSFSARRKTCSFVGKALQRTSFRLSETGGGPQEGRFRETGAPVTETARIGRKTPGEQRPPIDLRVGKGYGSSQGAKP
jgi:hypothetical protein